MIAEPPEKARKMNVNAILELAPEEPEALAEWLRTIPPDQAESVWVQAVVLAFPNEITGIPKGALARALNVVRAVYRAKLGTVTTLDKATLNPERARIMGRKCEVGRVADCRPVR